MAHFPSRRLNGGFTFAADFICIFTCGFRKRWFSTTALRRECEMSAGGRSELRARAKAPCPKCFARLQRFA